jgi:acyl transferase domain-containing protein
MPHSTGKNVPMIIEDLGLESDAIAVIGLDLKFPGDATSAEAFFEMLLESRSARSEVPNERFNIDAFYHPDQERAGSVSCTYSP